MFQFLLVQLKAIHRFSESVYSDETDQVFRSKLTNPSIGEKKRRFPMKKMGSSR
jgi:hypothetical protein